MSEPPTPEEVEEIINEHSLEEILMTEKLLAECLKQDIPNN